MTRAGDLPVIVVGAGVAGLATALRLAPMPVMLITAGQLGEESATRLAQGGIAAAIGADDAPALHAADTAAAAAGLGDASVMASIANAGPEAIDWLLSFGVRFDRCDGSLALGLEAAHARARILHADGDRTGGEISRRLIAAARATSSIDVVEGATVETLSQNNNGVVDGVVLHRAGVLVACSARAVVLATGGVGGLFAYTTNPLTSVGSGLALGARAGAILRDLEFVQFHPTAIDIGRDPMPLATEALRGEGARLVDAEGDDLMAGIAAGALAPRDVVAATLFARVSWGLRVFLELPDELARDLPRRFPGISSLCAELGIDMSRRRIPVRPAAHYHMGGLRIDARGRTSVEGLWACGEVASSGLHGANRLASNSLLEAVVYAEAVAQDIAGDCRPRLLPGASQGEGSGAPDHTRWDHTPTRRMMDRHVGVVRDEQGLTEFVRALAPSVFSQPSARSDTDLTALLIALSALARRESRGAHRRADYPATAEPPRSQEITLDEARSLALEVANRAPLRRTARG